MTASSIGASPAKSGFQMRRLLDLPPSYFVLAILLLVGGFASSTLLNPYFASILLRQAAPLGVIVLAQAIVMRVGSIDLSVSGVLGLTVYIVSAGVLPETQPWLYGVVPLVLGALIGLLNGVMVARIRASAVIATLAIGTILTGLTLYFSAGSPPGGVPDMLRVLDEDAVGPISWSSFLWLGIAVIVAFGLRKSIYGRFSVAIGNSPRAAMTAGLPLTRVVIVSHVLAGLLAAFGGLLQASAMSIGSIEASLDVVLNSIAAAILGGVTFGRDRGGVNGPFIAVIAFGYLFAVLTVFDVEESGKLIVQGLVIAAAAISYGVRTR